MSTLQGIESAFAIDLAAQTVFPMTELPNHAPKRRGGKKLNSATAYRWSNGVRAKDGAVVKLPTIQVGGTRCTSIEAFQWFCDRLSAGADELGLSATVGRRKSAERTARELDRLGI